MITIKMKDLLAVAEAAYKRRHYIKDVRYILKIEKFRNNVRKLGDTVPNNDEIFIDTLPF